MAGPSPFFFYFFGLCHSQGQRRLRLLHEGGSPPEGQKPRWGESGWHCQQPDLNYKFSTMSFCHLCISLYKLSTMNRNGRRSSLCLFFCSLQIKPEVSQPAREWRLIISLVLRLTHMEVTLDSPRRLQMKKGLKAYDI